MVDSLEDLLTDTSNLSLFCFYSRLFEDHFQMCLEFPAQNRYIIAFPLICGHFSNITNEFCPEERIHIRWEEKVLSRRPPNKSKMFVLCCAGSAA